MKRTMTIPEISIRIDEVYNESARQTDRYPVVEARCPNSGLGAIVLTHPDDLKLLREAIDRCLADNGLE